MYHAKLTVLGKTYEGKGESVKEALSMVKPGNVAGKCILSVNGKERVLPAPMVKRAYNLSGMSQEIALKNLSGMFDGVEKYANT